MTAEAETTCTKLFAQTDFECLVKDADDEELKCVDDSSEEESREEVDVVSTRVCNTIWSGGGKHQEVKVLQSA